MPEKTSAKETHEEAGGATERRREDAGPCSSTFSAHQASRFPKGNALVHQRATGPARFAIRRATDRASQRASERSAASSFSPGLDSSANATGSFRGLSRLDPALERKESNESRVHGSFDGDFYRAAFFPDEPSGSRSRPSTGDRYAPSVLTPRTSKFLVNTHHLLMKRGRDSAAGGTGVDRGQATIAISGVSIRSRSSPWRTPNFGLAASNRARLLECEGLTSESRRR